MCVCACLCGVCERVDVCVCVCVCEAPSELQHQLNAFMETGLNLVPVNATPTHYF